MDIKICGITDPAEAPYLNENRVSYAGFVLFEKSKRYVTCEQAKEIFLFLNADIKKVAVVVEPDMDLVRQIAASGFDVIQVHRAAQSGEESYQALLQEIRAATSLSVWCAVNIAEVASLEALPPEPFSLYDSLVVDAGSYGSGKTFGWQSAGQDSSDDPEQEVIAAFRRRMRESGKQFVLAGGLQPDNVAEGIRVFHPDIVDVSSGVEASSQTADGIVCKKDREKIKRFVEQARR
jgi:phosphoribosylanthranilate isomerase